MPPPPEYASVSIPLQPLCSRSWYFSLASDGLSGHSFILACWTTALLVSHFPAAKWIKVPALTHRRRCHSRWFSASHGRSVSISPEIKRRHIWEGNFLRWAGHLWQIIDRTSFHPQRKLRQILNNGVFFKLCGHYRPFQGVCKWF